MTITSQIQGQQEEKQRMSGANEEELNHGFAEVDEQDQEEEQEEKDPREGLGKIIDRERGPEGKLSQARLLCAICGSSEPRKAKKKVLLQKGVFIKDALKLTGRLCAICYKEVRERKLAEGKTVIQVLPDSASGSPKFEVHSLESLYKGCVDPVNNEYKITGVVGHSVQILYEVKWEGYASEHNSYLPASEIDRKEVNKYNKRTRMSELEKKIAGVVKRHKNNEFN